MMARTMLRPNLRPLVSDRLEPSRILNQPITHEDRSHDNLQTLHHVLERVEAPFHPYNMAAVSGIRPVLGPMK